MGLLEKLPQSRVTDPRMVLLSVKIKQPPHNHYQTPNQHHHTLGLITFFVGLKQPNKGLGWLSNLKHVYNHHIATPPHYHLPGMITFFGFKSTWQRPRVVGQPKTCIQTRHKTTTQRE